MKLPSLQTFLLQEDLNHTLLNDIYVLASSPVPQEEYPNRLYQLTAEESLQRFQSEAWLEILDILSREFLHIMDTDEFSLADSYDFNPEQESDEEDCQRLIKVLGLKDLRGLRMLGNGLKEMLENYGNRDTEEPIKFQDIQSVFKSNRSNLTLNVMIDAFEELSWEPEYGGEAWAEIGKAVLKIGEALNRKAFIPFYKALDHFVDLAHNTNSVLDKFKGYNEGWLFYWVDLKRYSKSVYDLNPVSKSVKEYLKVSRQDIPHQLRQRTPAKQNLYEVLLRGKQFTDILTNSDHNLTLSHLSEEEGSGDIEVLRIIKRNGITVPVLLQTMRQILDNVKNGHERLIEGQETLNVTRIRSALVDWTGIFQNLRYIKPEKQAVVLKKLRLPSSVDNADIINKMIQLGQGITPPKFT